eukprot:CAMPEP_0184706610 /NCGR_PEP_ID=MMETSP0313-20130426/36847_1 /TAXON_ID=2792 /ORGANISM="Porphyridium aerugineum, Strain SAG 1380-2" /LENGTH=127 /DNA_ID=CAMNT_0027168169 /DNA_START=197 /DNA_END=580 /DNA_ORIENTATION=+
MVVPKGPRWSEAANGMETDSDVCPCCKLIMELERGEENPRGRLTGLGFSTIIFSWTSCSICSSRWTKGDLAPLPAAELSPLKFLVISPSVSPRFSLLVVFSVTNEFDRSRAVILSDMARENENSGFS